MGIYVKRNSTEFFKGLSLAQLRVGFCTNIGLDSKLSEFGKSFRLIVVKVRIE